MSTVPSVTVVVPVYNQKGYLPRCLDSFRAQTLPDWEAVLVDDGSTDGSGAICDEYAARDARFTVIHKPNGGVCSARNAGLDAARGQYLLFCDQDDAWHPETLSRALAEKLAAPQALVCWPYTRDPAVHAAPLPGGCTDYPPGQIGSFYMTFMVPPVWNKLFERQLLLDGGPLRFDESVHNGHEDLPFVYAYLRRFFTRHPAGFVRMLRAPLYYWSDENSGSVSKKSLHYQNYLMVEQPLFETFLQDCRTLYHPSAEDLAPVYLHYLHTMAYGVVCAHKYQDMPAGFLRGGPVRALLCWLRVQRRYSPYYLPFCLRQPWLIRLVFYAEQKKPWLYGKLYWLGYYLLGGRWTR